MPHEKHYLEALSKLFFKDGPGPVLEPVGGEFQPSFATAYPGLDATTGLRVLSFNFLFAG
jgi:hypothetical protein